jgi:hypothetical protein
MSEMLVEKLNQLSKLCSEWEILNLEKQAAVNEVIPPEIRNLIEQIEKTFQEKIKVVEDNIVCLEKDIKAETVNCGANVKGMFLQAVFNKGIISWNTKGLEQYAESFPEVLDFRKQGNPFVSIRRVTKQTLSTLITPANKVLTIVDHHTDGNVAA